LLDAATCELAEAPKAGRRRVVIVEPHVDDAALSLGGTIWKLRDRCEFTVVTIGSRSNFTSYFNLERAFFDVERVTSLRKAEAELFARVTGGRHVSVGEREATLRFRDGDWTLEWYRGHRYSVSAFIGRRSSDADLQRWTAAVRAALRELPADELWLPIGVGAHTDHELTRNACLRALLEEPALAAGKELRLYQEVPYAAHAPDYTDRLVGVLERAGATLVPCPSPIDDVFDTKLRLLTIFGSQFKLEALRPGIETSARLAGGGTGRSELLWRLEALPRTIDPFALNVDAPLLERTAAPMGRWRRRHAGARRIRLLLLVAPGRWAEDIAYLQDALPHASFDVYATPASTSEISESGSPRVRLLPVASGPAAWALLALRLAASTPAPTLFVTGPRRLKLGRWLARLWPFSDPSVLASLDHFVTALRRSGNA
jgi:LmbE family N-acetylglucosaminyl deacetylase